MAGSGQGVQSQDIIKVSATSGLTPAPQARDHKVEVAKLIDVSTCIGCKACQVGLSLIHIWQCYGMSQSTYQIDSIEHVWIRYLEYDDAFQQRLYW